MRRPARQQDSASFEEKVMAAKQTGWSHVTYAESESEPGVEHEIKVRRADGHLGCSCLTNRFRKEPSRPASTSRPIRRRRRLEPSRRDFKDASSLGLHPS